MAGVGRSEPFSHEDVPQEAVTDRRVVQQYRFLWLSTKEIPTNRIISISEARNFFELITGRGSVIVSSLTAH